MSFIRDSQPSLAKPDHTAGPVARPGVSVALKPPAERTVTLPTGSRARPPISRDRLTRVLNTPYQQGLSGNTEPAQLSFDFTRW